MHLLLEFTILKTKNGILSSIMVGGDQKFCVPMYDDEHAEETVLWVNAENLEKGFRLIGYDNIDLMIRDIKRVDLKENVDFYEMSLSHNHTFYLVDSRGNRILTHNIFGIDDLIIIGLGCLVGGIVGGGIAAYKSYDKGVISKKNVAKGVLVGVVVGGVGTAIAYYGIIVAAKYLPIIMENAEVFLTKHFQEIKKVIEISKKDARVANFVGTALVGITSAAYIFMYGTISDFVDETAKRENEDIDFSGIDRDA